MPIVYKYIKALNPIRLFNGAIWMEIEDISRLTEAQFNTGEVQDFITSDDLIEVNENDLPVDVVSPKLLLRGEWDPSGGQLPAFRRIGDTYLVNAVGAAPYDFLEPGMRVLFTSLSVFEILVGPAGVPGPQGPAGVDAIMTWEYKDASFDIVSGVGYIVDTTADQIIATTPDVVTSTFYTEIKDAKGTFSTNSLLIRKPEPASYTIVGSNADLEIDLDRPILSLAYDSVSDNIVI